MDVLKAVRRTILRYELIAPGDTVIVAVSGGPDSLCLLHVLHALAPELSLTLHVGHLNHGLRGQEADADARFVTAITRAWGLPCTVAHADVAALAQQPGVSLEEAARHARYAFLTQLAGQLGASTVAVGHNADDQVETVLMHWLRGSGLAGLRGMVPKRDLESEISNLELGISNLESGNSKSETSNSKFEIPNSKSEIPNPTLIRPLLFTTRAEILAYCEAVGLEPRFDRSNEDTTLFRNRLRHDLLPILETYNPQVRQVLRRTATVLADDYQLLRERLAKAWPEVLLVQEPDSLVFDLECWRALPVALQRGLLREAVSTLRQGLRNIDFVHVENARWALLEGDAGTRMTLPSGLEVVRGYHRFVLGDEGRQLPVDDWPQLEGERVLVAVPGVTSLGSCGWQVICALIDRAGLPADHQGNVEPWQAWFDAKRIGPEPVLRIRRTADRFQPLGMDGRHKRLSELFTNAKVPVAARGGWPLLADRQGEIAWVCGLRPDERFKVTEHTERVLHVRFQPAQDPVPGMEPA